MPSRKKIKLEDVIKIARAAGIAESFFDIGVRESRKIASTTADLARIAITQSIVNIADKVGIEELKARLDEDNLKSMIKSQSRTSYRTALLNSYNTGTYREAIDNDDDDTYIIYDAVNDSRTRPNHAALDGVILKATDDFWEDHTPPLGYNCRCIIRTLTEGQARAERKEQKRSGIKTTKRELNKVQNGTKESLNRRKVQNPDGTPAKGRSDNEFDVSNPRDPVTKLDKILKDNIKKLPKGLRQPYRESLRRREAEASAWYERNKELFTN